MLLLRIGTDGIRGFAEPTTNHNGATQRFTQGTLIWWNQSLADVDVLREDFLAIPIIDQTGITGKHDITMRWSNDRRFGEPDANEGLKQTVHDQIGLELVPTNLPIEILVVDKVK